MDRVDTPDFAYSGSHSRRQIYWGIQGSLYMINIKIFVYLETGLILTPSIIGVLCSLVPSLM